MSENKSVELLADPRDLPAWFRPLVSAVTHGDIDGIAKFKPPAGTRARRSAVLVLLGEGPQGPDVLLIERAIDMRSHAGQPAFPGGAHETEDESSAATALREAREETLLDPTGVTVVASLPSMWLPPSGFVVTPVLGWWHEPSPVGIGDPAEVAAVHRVPISSMIDPKNRVKVSHPSGYIGPGFEVSGMLVWGFTGMLLDRLFSLGCWERPWEATARVVPFDDGWRQQTDGGGPT